MLKMDYTDDVRGTVIGESLRDGQLFYNGNAQSKRFFAKSHDELVTLAFNEKQALRASLGKVFDYTYPDDLLWELREIE